ncbi:MAG: SDR family NAD(P)-dependent oxidoreductase, partial [Acidimicrobiales bacterium]
MVRARSGTHFDPQLAAVVEIDPATLLDRLDDNTVDEVLAAEPIERPSLSDNELDAVLETVGDFCDLRWPYFAGHARRTAELVVGTTTLLNVPADEAGLARRAAFVHDVGRLGMPAAVWDRHGPLMTVDRPLLVAQGFGHIVNTASEAGLVTSSTLGMYCATKHAVVGLSEVVVPRARRHRCGGERALPERGEHRDLLVRTQPSIRASSRRTRTRRGPPYARRPDRWGSPLRRWRETSSTRSARAHAGPTELDHHLGARGARQPRPAARAHP